MGQLMYLRDVVTLEFDQERCVGCGTCVTVCPQEVLVRENGKTRIDNRDACMECGACAINCVVQAITVRTGVGCAAAVINGLLGRTDSACCCTSTPASA